MHGEEILEVRRCDKHRFAHALPIRLGWTHTCQKNDDVGMTGSTGVASYAIVRTWYVQRQKTLERPSEETGLSKLFQQIEAA